MHREKEDGVMAEMSNEEVRMLVEQIVAPFGLQAEITSVAAKGGQPAILEARLFNNEPELIGKTPRWDDLFSLSDEIKRRTPISRITVQLSRRKS